MDIYKILYLVDPEIASDYLKSAHTGHDHGEEAHDHHHVHTSFNKEPSNNVERALVETITRGTLTGMVPEFVKSTGSIYNNVTSKGFKEGLSLDRESEVEMVKNLFKESITRMIVQKISTAHRKEEKVTSQ